MVPSIKINENNLIKYLNKGQWKNEKFDGEGELIYPKDDIINRVSYNGQFKEGEISRKGNLLLKSGAKYEGDFENGRFNGFGVYTYPKEDAGDYYKGHWKDGKLSGKGKFVFSDGEQYEGDFENNLRNGFGVHTYSKESAGDYYEGHWKDNEKSGKGKLVWKDGTKQEGIFENGSFKQ